MPHTDLQTRADHACRDPLSGHRWRQLEQDRGPGGGDLRSAATAIGLLGACGLAAWFGVPWLAALPLPAQVGAVGLGVLAGAGVGRAVR